MPKILKIDIEQIKKFLKDNEGISIRKAVEDLRIQYNISISTEKLRQMFPSAFNKKRFGYKYEKIHEKAKQPQTKQIASQIVEREAIRVAKREVKEETKHKVEIQLKEILDSILTRMKIRMNVLNTIDYNLGKTIQPKEQHTIKELTPQDRKELASYIYALNKTSQFLFAELESFMKISDMADLKHLYKNIETNSGAELDEILLDLIGQNKLIDEKEEGGEENEQ